MTLEANRIDRPAEDPVSNILKWVLLVVATACFAVLGWTTKLTYDAAPPFPDRFVTSSGTLLLTAADIRDGKAGFQKADLMDYPGLNLSSALAICLLGRDPARTQRSILH
jgi:nitric oxide reductase subunit B